jgi:hypothetical protein
MFPRLKGRSCFGWGLHARRVGRICRGQLCGQAWKVSTPFKLRACMRVASKHTCCLEACVLPRSMRVASKHARCLEACVLPRSMRVASKHACCLEACVLPRSMTVVRRVDVHACGVVPSVPADDHVVRRSERADSDAHTSQTYHSKVGMWGDAVTKERTFRVRADLSVETLKC